MTFSAPSFPAVRGSLRLAYKIWRYGALRWIPAYLHDRRSKRSVGNPTDLIVCIADHFEPAKRLGPRAFETVRDWVADYAEAVGGLRDDDGGLPKHSWFYRFDFLDGPCVRELALASWSGLGEIEFHLHHGFDTEESYSQRLEQGLGLGATYGAMLTYGVRPSFGYIAGNWALNNGAGDDRTSGVDNELRVLSSLGCYGDFTFPALGSLAQPSRVNSVYFAPHGPGRRAYEIGPVAEVGMQVPQDSMLMFQGPLVLDYHNGEIEYSAIENFAPYGTGRVAHWLDAGVCVAGRSEWCFVKLHTHGVQSRQQFSGAAITNLYADVLQHCRRNGIRAHFVTAREMVNITLAAMAGKAGNAGEYRDFGLPSPPNTIVRFEQAMEVLDYQADRLLLRAGCGDAVPQIRQGASVVASGPADTGEWEIRF